MPYGHFDDPHREYVITSPATPYPWINYLGNEDFFGLISNTAGGYAFCKDAKYRRITRYRYNGVPMDAGGRYFYIKDGDTIWNPGWKPCKTELDHYECRHGMNYTRITGAKNGIEASVLFFVPLHTRVEVQKLTIHNTSTHIKHIKLFSFIEWCLWNAQTDMENFQRNFSTGEVEIDRKDGHCTIYHKTEYKERRDHYAYYALTNAPVAGFDTDRESFLGLYNGFDTPDVVAQGQARNSVAHGWSPIASHFVEIDLAPGEKKDYIFLLGYAENEDNEKFDDNELTRKQQGELICSQASDHTLINKAKAQAMISRFSTVKAIDEAFDELHQWWDGLLSNFSIRTNLPELDRMVNVWNQYQCMITFCFSRSASFFESGIGRGMGFRDSNQDLAGFVHLLPQRARQRILDLAATQFPDGSCYHQYQPLTKRGNDDIGSGFNDDPLWLVFGTVTYINETGDRSILDEPVPFNNQAGTEVSLLEHLKVSFEHVVTNVGPHGLPLIGHADWNDCLNLNCFSTDPNESFQTTSTRNEGSQAESLMIAGQFVFVGKQFLRLVDDPKLKAEIDLMCQAVEQYGWDGEWYLRAYDFFGHKVGSKECDEGQIFIESQGFCSMAEIGKDKGMPMKALASCRRLLDTPYGMVLNQPAYTVYRMELGEQSTYPAGYKENAGIFNHNNPWVICGEALAGCPEQAWEHYTKINPAWIKDQDIHKVEPYVYCQMVAGRDAARPGEGKNSWLTGTAAWNWLAISQYILGIVPEGNGIRLRPCLPDLLPQIEVHRHFREADYTITIRHTGLPSLIIDGTAASGDFITYQPGIHTVIYTY